MSHALGHRLRDGNFPAPSKPGGPAYLIVGGGISGLSAAWRLAKAGSTISWCSKWKRAGGNSRAGQSPLVAYPWGAHYLPLPTREAVHVRELLAELGVLQGDPAAKSRSTTNATCAPRRRSASIATACGKRGCCRIAAGCRRACAAATLPRADGRTQAGAGQRWPAAVRHPDGAVQPRPGMAALDRISFSQWLNDNGFTAPSCTGWPTTPDRDDYGMAHTRPRPGPACITSPAATAKRPMPPADTVLTAPDGNAWLARGLAKKGGDASSPGPWSGASRRARQMLRSTCWSGKKRTFRSAAADLGGPGFCPAARLAGDAWRTQGRCAGRRLRARG
jgi:hypothetical protein